MHAVSRSHSIDNNALLTYLVLTMVFNSSEDLTTYDLPYDKKLNDALVTKQ